MIELMNQYALKHQAKVTLIGDTNNVSVPSSWKRIPYTGQTYIEQIKRYNQDFDAVVGVNSGGLDLAVAAGLPAIRMYELGQSHAFNGFLCGALNLCIQPVDFNSPGWFDSVAQQQFSSALEVLFNTLKKPSQALKPRFVLVKREHTTVAHLQSLMQSARV